MVIIFFLINTYVLGSEMNASNIYLYLSVYSLQNHVEPKIPGAFGNSALNDPSGFFF
jgi:hypothetical protein